MDSEALSEAMPDRRHHSGFSLLELSIAMAITVGMGAVVFTLLFQNQNLFRDRNLTIEMQQSARAVASMMADEIRMAGQGVPAFAASMDTTAVESVQTFLNGTDAGTIVFRAGIRNGTAAITSPPPLAYMVQTPTTVAVDDVDAISRIVGENTDRFVFLWGQTAGSWTWVRARIDAIDRRADIVALTPVAIAGGGGRFPRVPNIQAEEALAYRLNSGNIQRATSGAFTTPTAPALRYATVGGNFTALSFVYRDISNNVVTVTNLDDRAAIRRVDFTLAAQTAEALPSTGDFGTFQIEMTVYPRNIQLY